MTESSPPSSRFPPFDFSVQKKEEGTKTREINNKNAKEKGGKGMGDEKGLAPRPRPEDSPQAKKALNCVFGGQQMAFLLRLRPS